ncbi:MAG: hypothetical protein QW514_06895 [Thermoprotei archaeon]
MLGLIFLAGLMLRLVPPLTTRGLPFFDSWGYYKDVLTMQAQHVDPLFDYHLKQYFTELPLLNFVLYLISSYTGIDAFQITKYVPPILLSLVMIPAVAAIASKVSGRTDIGLLAALLFALSDVGSLRESYALPEGISIAIALTFIICLIKALDARSPKWILLSGLLLVGVFAAHNLTPFMFLMISISVSVFMFKNQLVKLGYWLAAPITAAALFTSFTGLHHNIDNNPYSRYSQLLTLIFTHSSKIVSGKQFGNPLSGYITTQPLSYFFYLHVITVITLLLALPFFAANIMKKPRNMSAAITEVWLILAGATFILGVAGDSLFGSQNPFFGYRTWIYLMMPAAIGAAYTLGFGLRLPKKKRVIIFAALTLTLILTVPATVTFLRQTNDNFELDDAHDYITSVWLGQHVVYGNFTVYSTGGFYGSANTTLHANNNPKYFFNNLSVIFSNNTYYVVLTYVTLKYPFHTSGLVVPLNHFYNPFFDRVYASQTDWVFVYNPYIRSSQIAGWNQSG